MVEMMLLGFLMDGEKTGYDIKKYMENSTHYFFNTGFSSIYPTFKKLEKEGLVRVSQKIKNGKLNKVYSITDTGRKTFSAWLEVPPRIGRIRDEALLKVFFFDHLEAEKIEEQLDAYGRELSEQVNALCEVRERLAAYDMDPWKMATLEFGIRYYAFMEESFHAMFRKRREKRLSDGEPGEPLSAIDQEHLPPSGAGSGGRDNEEEEKMKVEWAYLRKG